MDVVDSSGCDGFQFPDFSMEEVSPVHAVNPLDLQKFKGKFVKVEGWNAVYYFGRVQTIDPVSLCVVLGRRRVLDAPIEIELIMGHIVKTIKVSEEHPWSSFISASELDSLFPNITSKEKHASVIQESHLSPEPLYTKENLSKRKEAVKVWLKKNLLPVNERGDSLMVAGGVTISPPYRNVSCTTGNEIIQSKIGKILDLMPGVE